MKKVLFICSLFIVSSGYCLNFPCDEPLMTVDVGKYGAGITPVTPVLIPGERTISYDCWLRVTQTGNDDPIIYVRFTYVLGYIENGVKVEGTESQATPINIQPYGATYKVISSRKVVVPDPDPNWRYTQAVAIFLYISDCGGNKTMYNWVKTYKNHI